jgi:hypothetical protein
MSAAMHMLHTAVYLWRRNQWRWRPSFQTGPEIPIDRPVYLIGTQGAGLTLLSRILQRHEAVISAAGGNRYWTGPDETQNVFEDVLPADLGWRHDRAAGENHNTLFATDDLLPRYLRGAGDADPALARRYRAFLQGVLRLHGATPAQPRRFLDKSQTLSLRIGLISALLDGCDPHFVLMLRNPFVMVWRAASGKGVLGSLPLPEETRLTLAIQQWRNLHEAALEQEGQVPMTVLRYEDFLSAPGDTVRKVCSFAGLSFDPAILPGPDDRMPLGSSPDARDGFKWYPIRPANNAKHLVRVPDWARERIAAECRGLIERFGYDPHC